MSQPHHTIRILPSGKSLRLRRWMLACLLLLGIAAQALHIKGGWIYYSYLGPGANNELRYKVVVKVYRDCAPPNPGQNDPQINISAYTGNNTFFRDFPAQLVRNYRLAKTSYSECINPKPEVCYVILEYETEISLPASPLGYTLSFQRCCRINGIVNALQPSNSLGNTYTITIPGTSVNPAFVQNSSPVFSMNDTVLVCYDSNITLDYGANDPDGDSLHFYFTDALMGADQGNPNPSRATPPPYGPIPYSAGFSATNPFGTNIQINNRTGLITGRSPSATGEYVLAVGVDEYRNGFRIASTRKELHVNVAGCTIAAAQLPPTIQNCDSFTVRFENLSHSPAILSYYWDFGVPNRTDDISTSPVPVFTYPDTGVYRAKLVINRESSCSDSAFTDVRIFPGFFPGFTVSGSCFASDFVFTDTSRVRYGNINSWRWDFGNGAANNDTSRLQQARYRYPGIGSYNATFRVTSSKGCSTQFSFPVQVTDKPALSLAFRDTLICSIDTLQLRASGTGTFVWNPSPTLINGNTATPLVFPKTTSRYVVTLTENTCVATDSVQVRVIDQVSLDAGPDTTICLTDAVTMRPVSNGLSFRWQPAAIFQDATRRNAVATPG
ncbi:MAG: PKD domain-containing protein, partial [Chitinophagaceae bacterium]|nr:PKD domain-containing protein [Chitinophagaceae bacterium]